MGNKIIMIISEKQIMQLIEILKSTLCFVDRKESNILHGTQNQKIALYNEIIKQQSEELKEIK